MPKIFRTPIAVPNLPCNISHKSKIFMIGSCFTENIGSYLRANKFQLCLNPCGILFNPISIEKAINYCVNNKRFLEDDLFYHEEKWRSFSHHGDFSNSDKEATLLSINSKIEEGHKAIKAADTLFITLGSAWVYRHKESKSIVANCHRRPHSEFTKEILEQAEIFRSLKKSLEAIRAINSSCSVIYTLSPVKHLRDGLIENSRSKAMLLSALHELVSKSSHTFYFPSYEIVTDELRDYRFYKSDMAHPSEEAVEYVWDFFKSTFFSDETKRVVERITEINAALAHKPRDPGSKAYSAFKSALIDKIEKLHSEYPKLCFNKEKEVLRSE